MKVTRLPRDPGPAAWNCLLEEAPPAVEVERNLTADWIVVGAGFAGLAAARRLSQLCPTDRIVVLEARRVAEGPAGRNSGFMIDLPHDLASQDYGGVLDHDAALTADNRHAIRFAADMAGDFGLPEEAFDARGKINAAATQKGQEHNRSFAQHLEAMGEGHEFLDAQQMRQLTGTDYYRGGLFTKGTVVLQPAMFVRGVAAGLALNRVQVFENSPVIALDRDGDWIATTPKGKVIAPKVILAVNGHLNSFGFAQNHLMHVFTYASMTRELSSDEVRRLAGAPAWGVTPADPLGTTVRRINGVGGSRIVIRNRFTFDPSMEVSDEKLARIVRTHDRSFAARFPMLKGVQMAYRWGGRLCLSRNNVNLVGEVDTNLYTACCQNGLGTTRGTLSGLLAAELATDTRSERLQRAVNSDSPKRLPPAPIAKIGADAVLKWQEFRAGAEL